ncbi:hypothetical protein DRF65_11710 [Chryseobacterium pennae]|uniref:Uncharacterized protein n=1 Tax=Chryseobacterium pennae TaxID=2258962 RepID=A0A3D9C9C8_9FLAO|nr:hypothetical protein [Chryseobacterium sp. BIGb0232]REC62369.1 hypothetical protein DRF65_11710 [Chryseobacterium pennae]ROS09631.1 hypothetical protein EDF65_4366 [Chryseobacterium nakagawai]
MQHKKYINLIHPLLDDQFAETLKKFTSEKERYRVISHKYNSINYKVKVYDKVCTPFIDLKSFEK